MINDVLGEIEEAYVSSKTVVEQQALDAAAAGARGVFSAILSDPDGNRDRIVSEVCPIVESRCVDAMSGKDYAKVAKYAQFLSLYAEDEDEDVEETVGVLLSEVEERPQVIMG